MGHTTKQLEMIHLLIVCKDLLRDVAGFWREGMVHLGTGEEDRL
jgi:hypothetical protein